MNTTRSHPSRRRPQFPTFTVQVSSDTTCLANLCGPFDENLHHLAEELAVKLTRHGNRITLAGEHAERAAQALRNFDDQAQNKPLSLEDIQLGLIEMQTANALSTAHPKSYAYPSTAPILALPHTLRSQHAALRPRTPHQHHYLNHILKQDITFGIGPAGTGKTWLAVACAIDALERNTVERLILTRPAVEAGERLGFLPGDLTQKVDPYLRPLYDALYDLMGFERVQRLFEKQIIEIAPLAYMRGRTLNHAFIILDEAQNTTPEQMKMFLTRIGFGSKAVITGDPSQIDLARGQQSGLLQAVDILKNVSGIAMTRFTSQDVVRHPLVARIIDAYDASSSAEASTHAPASPTLPAKPSVRPQASSTSTKPSIQGTAASTSAKNPSTPTIATITDSIKGDDNAPPS